jgi:CcmD family protein
LDDLTYLLIAYVIIWLGVFLYMLYLHIKQDKLSRDIEVLEETVRTYATKGKKGKRRNK